MTSDEQKDSIANHHGHYCTASDFSWVDDTMPAMAHCTCNLTGKPTTTPMPNNTKE